MIVGISGLESQHDRGDFDCREPDLSTFLIRFARPQSERDLNRTHVAAAVGDSRIRGCHIISASSVHFANLRVHPRLRRYPWPVARIGRLAVDLRAQGTGLSPAPLQHAVGLALPLSQQIGLFAVVVDANRDAAAAFDAHYGFAHMKDFPLSLYPTTAVIRQA